jgi:magnesium chelatase subunit I
MSESIRTLTDLISRTSADRFLQTPSPEDLGLAEHLPFPFLAIVGQREMKLAILLALINPNMGGVLLIGPRGTGKTTAVRGITELLPNVPRSRCSYGCLPEDITAGGIEAVCPDCARRFGEGEELTYQDKVRLIELPLNSRIEDVVGGIDERAATHNRLRLDRGILSRADRNILFVDEVNLLDDEIVNSILDASAQGIFTVHRGPLTATYRSRIALIGSMNPEEGRLRPQILDRFGLRVIARGLDVSDERLKAYKRSIAHRNNPHSVIAEHQDATRVVREEIILAREKLAEVSLTKDAEACGLRFISELGIHSLRAEITLFEAARAHAIADGRESAEQEDVRKVAPMALRLRRSDFIEAYLTSQVGEEEEIERLVAETQKKDSKQKRSKEKRKSASSK